MWENKNTKILFFLRSPGRSIFIICKLIKGLYYELLTFSKKKKLKGNMPDIYLLFLLWKLYIQKFVYGNTITKLEVKGF
jgi:hypothetical protein